MTKRYFVYTHHRVDNGEVFYVGCAATQEKNGHGGYGRAYDFKLREPVWFTVAGEAGGVIVTIVRRFVSRNRAFQLERRLIKRYGRRDLGLGFLVNQTDGGAGAGGQIGTPESRRRKAISKLGARNPMWGRFGEQHHGSRRVRNIASGEVYPSITAAAKALGYSIQGVANMLTGFRPNSAHVEYA